MTEYVLSDATREKLMRTSTASVATQLYKRGLRNQFIQGVRPVAPKKKNMYFTQEHENAILKYCNSNTI